MSGSTKAARSIAGHIHQMKQTSLRNGGCMAHRSDHKRSRSIAREHGIELSGPVKRHQIVATADMDAIDKDLWNGGAAIGPRQHLVAIGATRGVYFLIRCTFVFQQQLGPEAIRAGKFGEDFNFSGHTPEMGCSLRQVKWRRRSLALPAKRGSSTGSSQPTRRPFSAHECRHRWLRHWYTHRPPAGCDAPEANLSAFHAR